MARPSRYPIHPRDLVLEALRTSPKPLSAYDLLEALKPHQIKAPPIIYRALEQLMKQGLVHKVKGLGMFIACDYPHEHAQALSVLTICQTCHDVTELHDHEIIHQLESLRQQGVSLTMQAVIELPITCAACLV